ncbi:MAG: site-specific integrase, partial [Chloroflexota bacterium]|nr:site-specific integrase [Chloroflexota bacterium]
MEDERTPTGRAGAEASKTSTGGAAGGKGTEGRRTRRRGAGEGHIARWRDLWRGVLSVSRRLDGKPDYRFVYAKTRAECQAKLDGLKTSVRSGPLPADPGLTFGDFLERWLRDSVRPSVRPRTYESYRQQADSHLLPALGRYRLAKLGPDVLQGYYAAKLLKGLSSTTVKYHHAIIHRALKQAVRWRLAPSNAAEAVDPPRARRDEMRFLTPGEVAALLQTARAAADRLAALWTLAVYSGARQGELLGLRWSDVDLEAGTLSISRALIRVQGGTGVFAEPKTASSLRTVTLDPDAVAGLRDHRQRQDDERHALQGAYADERLVFCSHEGRPLDRFNVRRDFLRALERAGLPAVRFHDLRHTSATLMVIAGVHIKQMGARLGHADIHTTAKYSHLVRGLDRDAAERLGGALRAGEAEGAAAAQAYLKSREARTPRPGARPSGPSGKKRGQRAPWGSR